MSRITLRSQVLRAGAYLGMRHGAGTAINIAGVLLLTRTIGPHAYGIYAAAMGFFLALQLIAQLGGGVFLIRRPAEAESEGVYHTTSTLLLLLGAAGALAGASLLPFIEQWTRMHDVAGVALLLFATLPLVNLAQVPLARLERALDYRSVARVELSGQLMFFAVAIPLAFVGRGAWAPAAGWAAQQTLLLMLTHRAARYRPRFQWDSATIREALAYGGPYTASLWLYQLRKLVNPLVVGRYLGAEAVGIVAITTQIATHLSFMSVVTARLSLAALARVQGSTERLSRAVSEGMLLQGLAVGPLLVLFAWIAPVAVPLLLGTAWSGIASLYPFIAAAILAGATFNLHSATLYVLRMNGAMAAFHIVHTALLALAAVVLVPRFGLNGYGFAELIATASYFVLHASFARTVGSPAYGRALAVGAAMAAGLAVTYVGLWSLVAIAAAAFLLQPWREVSGVVTDLRRMAYE